MSFFPSCITLGRVTIFQIFYIRSSSSVSPELTILVCRRGSYRWSAVIDLTIWIYLTCDLYRWKSSASDTCGSSLSPSPNPPSLATGESFHHLLLPSNHRKIENDGTAGHFRPADDIFEDAAVKLEEVSRSRASEDSTMLLSKEDIATFTSLECCRRALRHVCDVKGSPKRFVFHW